MNIIDLATKTMQTAIKAVVDSIKITSESTKASVDNINLKISKLDAPYEVGNFMPFNYSQSIAKPANFTTAVELTGEGYLDVAVCAGATLEIQSGIQIIIDGVTLMGTNLNQGGLVGIINPHEFFAGDNLSRPHGMTYSGDSARVFLHYLPKDSYLNENMEGRTYPIYRPLKFKQSLVVKVKTGTSTAAGSVNVRVQGGLFV